MWYSWTGECGICVCIEDRVIHNLLDSMLRLLSMLRESWSCWKWAPWCVNSLHFCNVTFLHKEMWDSGLKGSQYQSKVSLIVFWGLDAWTKVTYPWLPLFHLIPMFVAIIWNGDVSEEFVVHLCAIGEGLSNSLLEFPLQAWSFHERVK